MEGERRFRSLVLIERLLAEPVAAAAGREVVQRLLQAVAAEEPLERPRRANSVLGRAGDGERSELGLDQRGGVKRLLVAGARGRLAPTSATVARETQHVVAQPGLVAEPAKGFEPELDQVVAVERVAAVYERL